MLSDKEIKRRLEQGELEIKNAEDIDAQLRPTGVDLRVGPDYIESNNESTVVDARNHPNAVLQLEPGTFYNIHTVERISMPDDLVGLVDGRSTLERSGVGLRTGGNVDPGFEGVLEFGIYNYTDETVNIEINYPIAQISFIELTEAAEAPYGEEGKFQGQEGVSGPEDLTE